MSSFQVNSSLNPFYLAIVVPYLSNIDSAKSFEMVSKKCYEAIGMIRVNPWYHRHGQDTNWHDAVVELSDDVNKVKELEDEVKLFRKIETIKSDANTLQQRADVVEKYKCLRIDQILVEPYQPILDIFKHKLVELKITIKTYTAIDLKEFEQLKRIKIISICNSLNLFDFFTDKKHRFEWVFISTPQKMNLFIEGIDQFAIERFVIETRKQNAIDIINIPLLSNKVQVCCSEWIENEKIIVNYRKWFLYSSRKNGMEFAMKLYCPSNIELSCLYNENEQILDLAKHTQIFRIKQQFVSKQQYLFPHSLRVYDGCSLNGLNDSVVYLLLTDIHHHIEIPQQIIVLQITNIPDWTASENNRIKQLTITNDNNNFNKEIRKLTTIKVLSLNHCEVNQSFEHLTTLTEIKMVDCSINITHNQFPNSIQTMICRNCKATHPFIPLAVRSLQLVGIKSDDDQPTETKNLGQLTRLVKYSSDSINDIQTLPRTIQYLSIKDCSTNETLSLKEFTSLTILGISNTEHITISIPSKLKEIYCYATNMALANANECQLDCLYFKTCKRIDWASIPKSISNIQVVPPIPIQLDFSEYAHLENHSVIETFVQPNPTRRANERNRLNDMDESRPPLRNLNITITN